MHLFKRMLGHKSALRANAHRAEVQQKANSEAEVTEESKNFVGLPNELQIAILQYLSYDDIAKLRRTCKMMNTLCSYILNRGFQQVGIDIDREKLRIKRELPRRESMRRSHRLSRLNDAYAGLDTRFSIMTMTYKKFIDTKATCFIPGKVLDEFFRIIGILKKSHDRGGALAIDIHELLKDLRDLSSMAMEHFEEHVQPSLTTSTSGSLASSYFMSLHPLLRPTPAQTSYASRDVDNCEWRKNITDKLAEQDKIIRKQNSEIVSLKSCIRQLVLVCTQLSDEKLQEIDGILANVLNILTTDGASDCHHLTQASTSVSNPEKGELLERSRKRSFEHHHSHEHCTRKKPRTNEFLEDEHTIESWSKN